MNIKKSNKIIKCDMLGCNNLAYYCVKSKEENKTADFEICEKCFKDLYIEMGKLIVPKGVEAPYKNLAKSRKNR